jgi:hypothetical protein
MRGHDALIAFRMRGLCPAAAFVYVGTDALRSWESWPHCVRSAPFAAIEVGPADRLSRLDLRCLVGMQVHVHGEEEERVLAVAQRALDDGAASVFAYSQDMERGAFINEGMREWLDF